MLEEIKLMLGESAGNYSDALIQLLYGQSAAEVEAYCGCTMDATMRYIAEQITVIKLNRIHTEGLSSQSFSGVSESYIDGLPANIIAVLNRKRVVGVF